MTLNCKRPTEDRLDGQLLGLSSVLARRDIWDSFASRVRPAIDTVRHTEDRSCGASHVTATSTPTFVTRRRGDASASTTRRVTRAINVPRDSMVMHWTDRNTIANGVLAWTMERVCSWEKILFAWSVRQVTLVSA